MGNLINLVEETLKEYKWTEELSVYDKFRLNKTERELIIRGLEDDGEIYITGNSGYGKYGGKKSSGTREYNAAESLLKKGLVTQGHISGSDTMQRGWNSHSSEWYYYLVDIETVKKNNPRKFK